MLTPEQSDEFERSGIVRIEAVYTPDQAARMRDVLWGELARRYGIEREDPATWDSHLATGFKSSKRHRAFAPILGPAVVGALDQLLGPGAWAEPKHFGQVLFTMPNAAQWRVPHKLWHSDFDPHLPGGEVVAVKYWALIDDVEPGGGGTPQLAGSHRLLARYIEGLGPDHLEYKAVRDGFMKSHPWLKALKAEDDDPGRTGRFMEADTDIDGLPARVVELTGRAGDVFLTHPWVFHSIAPNASNRPRIMRSMAVWRRDALLARTAVAGGPSDE